MKKEQNRGSNKIGSLLLTFIKIRQNSNVDTTSGQVQPALGTLSGLQVRSKRSRRSERMSSSTWTLKGLGEKPASVMFRSHHGVLVLCGVSIRSLVFLF